ncbi:hypothetical protein [Rothia mucilaginosa]|uniref:hypothetical protein n=1 Tax=Rothia mucilaginosa TaxID=43675 RepID=UPI0028ECFBEC|nr:hypothetical protein [Rothia mucilaginosa]
MNALMTQICLYTAGAYKHLQKRLTKDEAGMETIEIIVWAVSVLGIALIVLNALTGFVTNLLPKLTF